MYSVQRVPSRLMGENTYIITNKANQCVLIDPGERNLKNHPDIRGKEILAILLTHGHFDHIEGVMDLKETNPLPIYIHQKDEPMLYHSQLNLSQMMGNPFTIKGDVRPFIEENPIKIGDFTFTPFHSPGHTKGSVCYQLEEFLFTGDTLFAMGHGRVDFPGGSQEEMNHSLQKLLTFKEDTKVYSGHGEESTIKQCREFLYASGLLNQ